MISARVAYSMVWFDMAALFPALRSITGYSASALGAFTTAFLLGSGVFQVPAGFLSARLGAARTTLAGLLLIALFTFGSAFSPGFLFQFVMRFLTGLGAAFFFAPAMVVASQAIGGRRSGLVVGVYNGAFNVGGGIALFVFTPLSVTYGWRFPYLVIGALLTANLVVCTLAFRGVGDGSKLGAGGSRTVFTSKPLWVVIVGIVGLTAAYYVISQFVVEYSENFLGFSPYVAGTVSSMILFGGIIGGPLGGWLLGKRGSRVMLATIPSFLVSVLVLVYTVDNAYVLGFSSFALGLFDGMAYTVAYVLPIRLRDIEKRFVPLAIGLVNSVGIVTGSVASVMFAQGVVSAGYSPSWIALGIGTMFFPLAVVIKRKLFTEEEAGQQSRQTV